MHGIEMTRIGMIRNVEMTEVETIGIAEMTGIGMIGNIEMTRIIKTTGITEMTELERIGIAEMTGIGMIGIPENPKRVEAKVRRTTMPTCRPTVDVQIQRSARRQLDQDQTRRGPGP